MADLDNMAGIAKEIGSLAKTFWEHIAETFRDLSRNGMGHNMSMEAKHVRRKVTATVPCRLVGGELCFAELLGDRFSTRNRNVVGKNKVSMPFFFEPFFCCLEETNLFVEFGSVGWRVRHAAWTSATNMADGVILMCRIGGPFTLTFDCRFTNGVTLMSRWLSSGSVSRALEISRYF